MGVVERNDNDGVGEVAAFVHDGAGAEENNVGMVILVDLDFLAEGF